MPDLAWAVVLLAALAAAVWIARRRTAARRRARAAALAEELRRVAPGAEVAHAGNALRIRWGPGDESELGVRALERTLMRGSATGRGRPEALAAALAFTRSRPQALAGELDLKTHGPLLLPLLARSEHLPLLGEPPVPHTEIPGTGLAALYVVAAPDGGHLTAEHLERRGLDAAAVHGVALAVLRQRFDPEPLRAAVERGEGRAVEADDGLAGSRLLLLPENLAPGEEVAALVPDPATLRLAPAPRGLAGAEVLAAAPLLSEPLRVSSEGFAPWTR